MQEIRSLDLRLLIKELKESISGGRIRKIYQRRPAQNCFQFGVSTQGRQNLWLYVDSSTIFLTRRKIDTAATPPGFCMLLRKHLLNRRILGIRQHGFDRVTEIEADGCVIIFEFVPPGNAILCDSSYNIIMPLRLRRWKDREILPKRAYVFPPAKTDPFAATEEEFSAALKDSGQSLMTALSQTGFGSVYANEICRLSGISPETSTENIREEDISSINNIIRKIADKKTGPVIYSDGMIAAFPLESKTEKIQKTFPTLSEALENSFFEKTEKESDEKRDQEARERRQKLERIVRKQQDVTARYGEKKKASREYADIIYRNYGIVDRILKTISRLKEEGKGWDEIRSFVLDMDSRDREYIDSIREKEGLVVVSLEGRKIGLDYRISVEKNAASYYDESKSSGKKLKKAERAMEERIGEIERLENEPKSGTRQPEEQEVKKATRKWYESFRSYVSSEGYLIVAGKDAESNEGLIKRHMGKDDLVFHCDLKGSAFVLIKGKADQKGIFSGTETGQAFPERTRREAAEISAALSKAWSMGLGNADVYAVRPEQLSKSPPSGQHLAKGSFMVYGLREWYRGTPVRMQIGIRIDRGRGITEVISGPEAALRSSCSQTVTLRPGEIQAKDLAREIKSIFLNRAGLEDRQYVSRISLDDIQKLVPSGRGQISG